MNDNNGMAWAVGSGRVVHLDRPHLLGIVNASPDSFSDGGNHPSVDALTGHALRLVEEGASIIDVGGASTRPGAVPVSETEQIDRVVPVITELRVCSQVLISIDTTRAAVAAAALDAGADVVNDVAAGQDDDALLPLVAERGVGVILMHRRLPPEAESYSHQYAQAPAYDDVVRDVIAFLRERAVAAEAAGVGRDAIVVDPGLGFGKSVDDNYELIRRSGEIVAGTGYPMLSAASRKSFIGAATQEEEPRRRVTGSTAVSVSHYLAGVRLFRVHDVAAHREALAVARAIADAGRTGVPAASPGAS
jgi:dihydropteroate synthase